MRFIAAIRNAAVHDGDTFKIDKNKNDGFIKTHKILLNAFRKIKAIENILDANKVVKMSSEIESMLENLGAQDGVGGMVQKFNFVAESFRVAHLKNDILTVASLRNSCVHDDSNTSINEDEANKFINSYKNLVNGLKVPERIKILSNAQIIQIRDELSRLCVILGGSGNNLYQKFVSINPRYKTDKIKNLVKTVAFVNEIASKAEFYGDKFQVSVSESDGLIRNYEQISNELKSAKEQSAINIAERLRKAEDRGTLGKIEDNNRQKYQSRKNYQNSKNNTKRDFQTKDNYHKHNDRLSYRQKKMIWIIVVAVIAAIVTALAK